MKTLTSQAVNSFRDALFFEHDNIASIMMSNALKNAVEEIVIILDKSGILLSFNQQARTTYGPDISVGASISKIWGAPIVEIEEALFSTISIGNWRNERTFITSSKNKIILKSHWLRLDINKENRIAIIESDITELRACQDMVSKSNRLQSLGALAGGVVHDLNNILTPISLSINKLEKIDDPDVHRTVTMLVKNIHRATDLIKEILTFIKGARQEAEFIDVNSIILEVARLINETFPKNIDFAMNLNFELWKAFINPTHLHQVIMNLCVNARDAMPEGGTLTLVTKSVQVMHSVDNDMGRLSQGKYVLLQVIDSGSGIPESLMNDIFKKFFTTKIGSKGTGLGLSTVLSLVKFYDGYLSVKTGVGEGTTFSIYLPAKNVQEKKPNQKALSTFHKEDSVPKKILIADDEPMICNLIETILKSAGFSVIVAKDGLEAVNLFKAQKNEICLLITDINMPRLNGIKCAQEILGLDRNCGIIFASGELDPTDQFHFFSDSGVTHAFLRKPFSQNQLLGTVTEMIKKLNPTGIN